MRIAKLKLRNYKSFDESPELTFTSGFNVIAGQNSTGKTALLEVLSLAFDANPHRSLKTLPTRDTILDPVSSAEVSVTLERDELLGVLAAFGGNSFFIALPAYPTETCGFNYINNDPYSIRNLVEHVFSMQEHTFTASLRKSVNPEWSLLGVPSNGLYQAQTQGPNNVEFGVFQVDRERRPSFTGSAQGPINSEFGISVMNALPSRIFRFTAERLNVGDCRFGTNTSLAPNAGNLAEVLNSLQQNPVRFAEFNRIVHQILPQVQQVTVRPISTDSVTHVRELLTKSHSNCPRSYSY